MIENGYDDIIAFGFILAAAAVTLAVVKGLILFVCYGGVCS